MNYKNIRFSVELEVKETTQRKVVRALQHFIAGSLRHQLTESSPNIWAHNDTRLVWQISKGEQPGAVKVTTPPFQFDELPMVSWVVGSLQKTGAHLDRNTLMKVSIDKSVFDTKSLTRLIEIFYRKQNAVYDFCKLPSEIISKRCKKLPIEVLTNIKLIQPRTIPDLRFAWYSSFRPRSPAGTNHQSEHYGLNLHSFFWGNEVKFQHYLATFDSTRLENNIRLALMMTAAARVNEP